MRLSGSRTPKAQGSTARAFSRVLIQGRWVVIAVWVSACLASVLVLPALSASHGGDDLKGLLPKDTPAVTTELRSVQHFGFPLLGRTVVVQRNPDGLSVYDQARTVVNAADATAHTRPGLGPLRGALPLTNALGAFPASSERGTTALTFLLFEPDVSFGTQTRVATRYAQQSFSARDDVVGVTGSVPARSEQGDLIREALPHVELFTLGAIVIIVGAAFRSVVAPAVAVLTTGVAYVITMRLSGWVADAVGQTSPSELEPVIVALLLGVVTDYVVFYLAELRRQIAAGQDRLSAARAATARYGPIVIVAGLAVAAGTAALLVADSLFFRALGPALVFTVMVALLVSVTLVPALMAVLGRWSFWPSQRSAAEPRTRGPNARIVAFYVALGRRRGVAAVVATCAITGLALAATPLAGLNLGVSFVGSLPEDNGVRQAAVAARTGFAPGILSPTTVLLEGPGVGNETHQLDTFGDLLEEQPGVAGVLGPGDLPRRIDTRVLVTADGAAARYLVILDDPALGAAAIDSVGTLSDRLPELLAQSGLRPVRAGLAGDTAAAAHIVDQTSDDLFRIAVAALGANLLMLIIFLRAPVAATYLLVGSVLSLGGALGLTVALFDYLDQGSGLTFYVPFAAAVLLLAFGSDYNILTVGNIWEEARSRPLSDAIGRAMPTTLPAILVAGVALTVSFGLLAVVPLAPFRQLAVVMAFGILLDVLVVRSLLVPALVSLVGPASAWPSRRLMPRGGLKERSHVA